MPPLPDHASNAYVAPQLTILGSVESLTLGSEGCDPEPSPFPGELPGDTSPC